MSEKEYFDSAEFEKKYHYDGPLGFVLREQETQFLLWAPTAEEVVLHLYREGAAQGPEQSVHLERQAQGVWSVTWPENLNGRYYDYEVTVDGNRRRTADPYAIAAGVNGMRSMVVDLAETDPDGWDQDQAPAKQEETIIYELHTREFSWDPSGGFPEEYRGKFKAFCLNDTCLNGNPQQSTGINYLKWLGVTHVQLMPVYDYGSVDESNPEGQFNWGYDPWNYNLPEGSYSTDPYHGEVRIRELKEAIASLHANGFRVIMDVVYNHTYRIDSWLWRTVPWYFYRQNKDGSSSNGSGCSNDLASERSMCARYILDSVLYWTREYHIDGFRFDLMGLLDVKLMNRIQKALDETYGAGEKLVFGEPWRAGNTEKKRDCRLADKEAMYQLNGRIGAFCDATRDAVKGNLMQEGSTGFVNGGGMNAKALASCVTAWAGSGAEFDVQSPAQTITYLSSHDDWTLWDRLVFSMDPAVRFDAAEPEIVRANRMAVALCFACQGNLFLLSGEEFARTKYGIRDAVRTPIEINRIDWKRAWDNRSLVEYYRGFIALRKQLPGLCDKSRHAKKRLLEARDLSKDCVMIRLDNRSPEQSKWSELLILANASDKPVSLTLPEGTWQVLADEADSFLWEIPQYVRNQVILQPKEVALLGITD